MSSFFIKGMNSCAMRNQNIAKYRFYLTSNGYNEVYDETKADNIIVWTCSFRDDKADNSFRQIENFVSDYSSTEIFAVGCMPDMFPGRFAKLRCHTIPWKQEQELFSLFFPPIIKKDSHLCDYDQIYVASPTQCPSLFIDSFIKLLISEGCNEKCVYCSERLVFPPYRSFSKTELVKKAKQQVLQSKNNIIAIMADSPGEYGCDTGCDNIITLINSLCDISDDVKIVLQNMNPAFFLLYLKDFKELIFNGRIYHLNLPIQSANNRILNIMGRRYKQKDLDLIFDSLSQWDFKNYDTHIISGFPTESAEEFDETIEFLYRKKPTYVLASPCMITSATPTNDMFPKISEDEKQKRLDKLERRLTSNGIIVNTPYNDLGRRIIKETQKRMQ